MCTLLFKEINTFTQKRHVKLIKSYCQDISNVTKDSIQISFAIIVIILYSWKALSNIENSNGSWAPNQEIIYCQFELN